MHDATASKLKDILGDLERLFESRAPVWEKWAADSIALLEAGDRRAADHVLQAFGGMGGLADLVFSPANGNASSLEEAELLQQELDTKRPSVHALAVQLQSGSAGGVESTDLH